MKDIDERFRKEFEELEKTDPLFQVAEQLINKYGKTGNIPLSELENIPNGFSDVDLLACCKLFEKKRNESTIH